MKKIILIIIFLPVISFGQKKIINFDFDKTSYDKIAVDSTFIRYDYSIKLFNQLQNSSYSVDNILKKEELEVVSIPIFLASSEISNFSCEDNIIDYIDFDNMSFFQKVYIFDKNGKYIDDFNLPAKWVLEESKIYSQQKIQQLIIEEYEEEGFFSIPENVNISWALNNPRFLNVTNKIKIEKNKLSYFNFIFQNRNNFMFYSMFGLYLLEKNKPKIFAPEFNVKKDMVVIGKGKKKYKYKLFDPNEYIKSRYSKSDIQDIGLYPDDNKSDNMCGCSRKSKRIIKINQL